MNTLGFQPGPTNPQPFTIHTDTVPDLIAWLPDGAADKLRMLRQRIEDLHAVVPLFEERKTANEARFVAEQRLKRLQDHPQDGGFALPDDDRRVIDARRNLDKLTDAAKRLTDRYAARSQTWQAASSALSGVEAWLRDGGKPSGTVLEDFNGPEPKLAKGEASIVDAIENRRRRAREVQSELHRIRSAPFPSSYAKQQMRAQIDALAARGAVNVSRLVELDRDIEFPTTQITSMVRNVEQPGAATFVEVCDVAAVTCWLHRDALIARLDAEIDGEADDKSALTHEARQQQEAEALGDLLAVERDESALVWRAQADRLPVEHRADINPLALLGLRLVTPAPVDQSPGSSAMHAYDLVGLRRRR